jgi:hypothetical protein
MTGGASVSRHRIGAAADAVSVPYRRTDDRLYSASRVKTYFGEDVSAATVTFAYGLTADTLALQLKAHVSVDSATDYRLRARYRRARDATPFRYAVDGCHRDGTVYLAATGDVAFEPSGEEVDHNPGGKRLRDVVLPAARRLAALEFLCDHRRTYGHLDDAGLLDEAVSFLGEGDGLFVDDG